MLINEMRVHLYMLGAFVEDMVGGNFDSTMIVMI